MIPVFIIPCVPHLSRSKSRPAASFAEAPGGENILSNGSADGFVLYINQERLALVTSQLNFQRHLFIAVDKFVKQRFVCRIETRLANNIIIFARHLKLFIAVQELHIFSAEDIIVFLVLENIEPVSPTLRACFGNRNCCFNRITALAISIPILNSTTGNSIITNCKTGIILAAATGRSADRMRPLPRPVRQRL